MKATFNATIGLELSLDEAQALHIALKDVDTSDDSWNSEVVNTIRNELLVQIRKVLG